MSREPDDVPRSEKSAINKMVRADAIQDAHAERCSWMETPASARAI
jgi:hypothetical protein